MFRAIIWKLVYEILNTWNENLRFKKEETRIAEYTSDSLHISEKNFHSSLSLNFYCFIHLRTW